MITQSEIFGIIISLVYAGSLILAAEVLRRLDKLPQKITRKIVHIGAGMWVFGILALFTRWQVGIVPFALFIVINFIAYRKRIFSALETDKSTPGTVYFAAVITLLFAIFWRPYGPIDRAPVAVAGVMALTWGDALAALIGQHWGKHRYTVLGEDRSWEGTAAMFLSSFIAIALVLLFLPGSALSPNSQVLSYGLTFTAALLAALVSTIVEAVSPRGIDNLAIPFAAALVVWLLTAI
jgi:phytol kinase